MAQAQGSSNRSTGSSGNVYYAGSSAGPSDGFCGRQRSLLPDFPSVKNLPLVASIDPAMMETFLVMYKTHCQRVLDSVIRANFEEVQHLLVHFWQGIPTHLHPLLTTNAFANMVCACDSILYKSITAFMFTSVIQSSMPENLTRILRKFSGTFDAWIRQSMGDMPDKLKQAKTDLAKRFSNLIKRQLSISQLCSAARMITNNSDLLMQMFVDWHSIDSESIIMETTLRQAQHHSPSTTYHMADGENGHDLNMLKGQVMRTACEEFVKLLEREPPLESFLEWLDSLTHKCVIYVSLKHQLVNQNKKLTQRYPQGPGKAQISSRSDLTRNSQSFLSMWSSFVARLMRNLTLQCASSFGMDNRDFGNGS